jgi:hypothetical protein
MSAVQRLPSVAAANWVHGAWHEAVIGSPSSTAASMAGIEMAAVIQLLGLQVLLEISFETQQFEGMN